MFIARDTTIVNQMNGLNQLAETLGQQVNTIHQGGFGLPTTANPGGATGLNFFTYTAGNAAATLAVNSALTPEDLAAASAAGQPGNADRAVLLAGLKGAKTMNGGTASMAEFYNGQITALGIEVQAANRNAYHNNLVRKALSDQRESVAGVNLDEEAANLVKFQRAYQAAARVMTVYDEMLDKVINGMGLVGR
jgi:flagellar hook-associated protein 1 FlgK